MITLKIIFIALMVALLIARILIWRNYRRKGKVVNFGYLFELPHQVFFLGFWIVTLIYEHQKGNTKLIGEWIVVILSFLVVCFTCWDVYKELKKRKAKKHEETSNINGNM